MRIGYLPGLAAATIAATAAAWVSVHAQNSAATAQSAVDFARDIQPILQAKCYECHGPKKTKAKLRLDSQTGIVKGGESGAIIVAGKSEHSLIVRRVLGLDGDDRMPKDGDALPPAQVALLRAWIDQGASWPQTGAKTAAPAQPAAEEPVHWAYRKPARPAVPDVKRTDWVRTPIDRFILARLEKEGLNPSADAPFETLIRRVSLDLIGLPPSPAEVDAVLADAARDGKDAAYARLVDRLLASPHYGERWARPWLDLARYADSQGYEKDLPRVMWKYRDWVIDALNHDMPFDRFTIEQIAGDMLQNPTTDQLIASGFHRNAMTNEEGGIDPEEARYEVLVDRVNTTATVWLGTTLGCAQCHNHKYDPFTQKDYYRMMAFFQNSYYDSRTFGDGTRYFEATLDVPTPEQEARRKKIQEEIDRLDATVKLDTPAIATEQRAWEQEMRLEFSAGWQVLTPARLAAEGGVALTAEPDGSVLASGSNPGETVYVVAGATAIPGVTAIRVEALPDPSLPKGGPGRDPYGNFVLNGIEIISGSTRVGIKSIRADEAVGGTSVDAFFPKALPRDASAPRGWRIDASREEKRLAQADRLHVGQTRCGPGPARDSVEVSRRRGRAVAGPVPRVRLFQRDARAGRRASGEITARSESRRERANRTAAERSDELLSQRRGVAQAHSRSNRGASEGPESPRHPDRARHARTRGLRATLGLCAAPR